MLLIFLFTEKPYKKFSIQKRPNKRYFEPGSNVKLTCDVGNATFYAMTWYKPNFLGNLRVLKSVFNVTGNLSLELNSLNAHDLGTYICKVFRSQHYYNSLSVTIQFKGIVQLTPTVFPFSLCLFC